MNLQPVTQQRMAPHEIMTWVEKEMMESVRAKQAFMKQCVGTLSAICAALVERLERGGKLLLFGNGGSAADAQHIAAEFVGRYQLEREALPAMALTVNSSTLTAVANDYGYEEVFARQVGAFGTEKDAAIGISTSGNSQNVLRGQLKKLAGMCICVPSKVTARIQECHILAGHIVSRYCEHVMTEKAAHAARRG